jgi:hypothetical protein
MHSCSLGNQQHALGGAFHMSNVNDSSTPNTPAAPKAEAKASKPVVEIAKDKRTSHLKLGPALLKAHATEEQINEAFTKSFKARGVTDKKWIAGRTAIYMRIAKKTVEAEKAAKKAVREAKAPKQVTAVAKLA